MNTNKLRYILYLIVLVIASTIAIQVYWNFKNYQTNKQQLINDVQVSLDKAVNTYYENLTKKNTLGFVINDKKNKDFFKENGRFSTIIKGMNLKNDGSFNIDSISPNAIKNISIFKGFQADSLKKATKSKKNNFNLSTEQGKARFKNFKDSVKTINNKTETANRVKDFEFLTSQVIFSMTNDSIKLRDVDSLLQIELFRKAITVNYGLTLIQPKKEIQIFNALPNNNKGLSTVSKSTFLPENSTLTVYFKNETKLILKRIFGGILISTLLVLAIISCLFYLLKIINKQKHLAEVKNDLISNITHEFKTPIATIAVAIESIKDFNAINDKEKTKKYLNLSTVQLSKLNIMVEKLLETATLDSENLKLNKDTIDLVGLVSILVDKLQMQTDEKKLIFNASAEKISAQVDIFHFENAINNIVDNAVKYGGDNISVLIEKKNKNTEILISDNGNSLTKQQAAQVFDKFYRVPKGNTHDVKGFGIGLYYTKKIIEKHNGTISISINNGTTFKITLPNER